ncbi:2Fe-2S iron-sulfur cluster-binding protein [Labilibaculum sp.]|uniref:2Fe-2S iron-sulfur cluster-binding protein n=1 Tax=Labilibaculum sp. TaxID=2060723 RepID=UPI003561F9D9
MLKLRIDNIAITVPEGTTVLNAARTVGIEIPSMCYLEGCSNHPTCMVCMVRNNANQQMLPSCATKVTEGMDLASNDPEVFEARKEAIELLLSDHVGDCEAPCRVACPAYMDIPKMNRFIANGKFIEALKIVKEEIALPGILGYICSAPCEKVCRRKDVDQAVSICLLKRFSADEEINFYLPKKKASSGKKVAVIGSGPAGLSVAYHLFLDGHSCDIFEKENSLGGSLNTCVNNGELPNNILEREIEILKQFGLVFHTNQKIGKEELAKINSDFDAVILASGNSLDSETDFGIKSANGSVWIDQDTFATNSKGIFATGSIIRFQKMAVKAVAMGKECAWSVDEYLKKGEGKATKRTFNSRFGTLRKEELEEYLKESVEGDRIEAKSVNGFTKKEAIEEAKRCLHCDCRKVDNCKLRTCADAYQADRRKFLFGERNNVVKYFNHQSIIYEPEKCIKCGLCIEIAEKYKEQTGLTNIGRGFTVKVAVPFNQEIDKALRVAAKDCAEACPTGAISLKKLKSFSA